MVLTGSRARADAQAIESPVSCTRGIDKWFSCRGSLHRAPRDVRRWRHPIHVKNPNRWRSLYMASRQPDAFHAIRAGFRMIAACPRVDRECADAALRAPAGLGGGSSRSARLLARRLERIAAQPAVARYFREGTRSMVGAASDAMEGWARVNDRRGGVSADAVESLTAASRGDDPPGARTAGARPTRCCREHASGLQQIHSPEVVTVTEPWGDDCAPADALVIDRPACCSAGSPPTARRCCWRTARGVVGAAHAGWKARRA